MAKATTWSKTMEEFLHNLNNVLASMGLMEKDSSLLSGMSANDNKEHMARVMAARQALEEELITSGGQGVLVTEARQVVLSTAPIALLQKLRDGSTSSVLVLEAFQAKAIEESKRTNCITEFIPDAKKWAESIDAIKKVSEVHLPLHGLPISIKDNINVEGLDTTVGLQKNLDKPAECDAVFVQVVKKLGAIPFVKTNVPQLCLSFACSNPIWGETVSPHDSSRTCGGSSGGEGALIAGGGSFLGLGTDVGGSVRIPATFNGIVALKPTSRRISNIGVDASLPGAVGIFSAVGFLGRDVPIVVEATKAVMSADFNQYDQNAPPVPWRDDLFASTIKKSLRNARKPLRIGWYDFDGINPTTPGVKRAVAESVAKLKELGHELVPFSPPDIMEAMKLFMDFIMADNGHAMAEALRGETVDPSTHWLKTMSAVPAAFKSIAKPLIRHQFGELNSELTCTIGAPYQMWQRLASRDQYVGVFLKSWKKEELDLVLCPVFPCPATPKDFQAKITLACFYCMLYNLLDFPSIALPVTRETEEDQKQLDEYTGTDCIHDLIKEYTRGSTGMPLGVQMVALPYSEEILCRAALEFGKALNFTL